MKRSMFMMLCASMLFTVGCSKNDDPTPDPEPQAEGNVLVSIMQPNPDGMSGSSYMQLIDENNLSEGINLSTSMPIPYGGSYPQVFGNDVFVFPSYMGDTRNEFSKYTISNGVITSSGKITLPEKNSATNMVLASPEKAYLSLAGLGKVLVFNPKTMTKTGEIDLTSLGLKDNNPDPGAMIYRGGYLFVGLGQMVAGYTPPADYPQADVAIIKTSDDTLLKMISTKVGGIAMATRPVDAKSIFLDEKGDIYINCVGSFGWVPTLNPGILRIKKGSLEFDESYNWVVSKSEIAGDDRKGTVGFISSIHYAGNGIAYGYADIPSYYNEGETGMTAYSNRAIKFDLYNKTMTMVKGMELSNGYAIPVSNTGDDIIMANASRTNKGIYLINQETNSVAEQIMKTEYNIMNWTYIEE